MRKFITIALLILLTTLSACNPTKNSERIFMVDEGQDTVEINTTWEDAGAWLEYGNMIVDVDTSGTVDTSVLGLYEIEYTLIHEEISYSEVRYVIVVDQTPPVITLNLGIDTVKLGESWTDAGATVIDNSGEQLSIVVSGTVDTSIIGTYEVNYFSEDSSGNEVSTIRFVTVIE